MFFLLPPCRRGRGPPPPPPLPPAPSNDHHYPPDPTILPPRSPPTTHTLRDHDGLVAAGVLVHELGEVVGLAVKVPGGNSTQEKHARGSDQHQVHKRISSTITNPYATPQKTRNGSLYTVSQPGHCSFPHRCVRAPQSRMSSSARGRGHAHGQSFTISRAAIPVVGVEGAGQCGDGLLAIVDNVRGGLARCHGAGCCEHGRQKRKWRRLQREGRRWGGCTV